MKTATAPTENIAATRRFVEFSGIIGEDIIGNKYEIVVNPA